MVQLYTPSIFQKLKDEHNKILYVMVELLSEANNLKTYTKVHVDASRYASLMTFISVSVAVTFV